MYHFQQAVASRAGRQDQYSIPNFVTPSTSYGHVLFKKLPKYIAPSFYKILTTSNVSQFHRIHTYIHSKSDVILFFIDHRRMNSLPDGGAGGAADRGTTHIFGLEKKIIRKNNGQILANRPPPVTIFVITLLFFI